MAKIICYLEPIVEVDNGLSESQITQMIGHNSWDYVDDDVPATHTLEPEAGKQTRKSRAMIPALVSSVAAAISLLPMLILPVSAEWKSPWPTKWVEINNTGYLVPYFPGKRLIGDECYFIERGDSSLRSEGPDGETGVCNEG